MLLRFLSVLTTMVMLVGAGLAAPTTVFSYVASHHGITVDGMARSYLLAKPVARSAGPLPVIVELHGCCTTPLVEYERAALTDATHAAILVYPSGYQQVWNAGWCCSTSGVDDVAFVAAVVKQVLATQPRADPSRVYLVGYSNGGRMAYRIACEMPQLFTAVAIYAALPSYVCTSPTPINLLLAIGSEDVEVHPALLEGYISPTLEAEYEMYESINTPAGKKTQITTVEGIDHHWRVPVAYIVWNFLRSTAPRAAASPPPIVLARAGA